MTTVFTLAAQVSWVACAIPNAVDLYDTCRAYRRVQTDDVREHGQRAQGPSYMRPAAAAESNNKR